MAGAVLRIERLRCDEPQDSLTDEVKLQFNGRQVWPNAEDGFFSMSKGNEVPMLLDLSFGDSPTARVTLFDDEDIGSDDNLGSIDISEAEANTGPKTKQIVASGSQYTLFYRVGKFVF